MSTIDNTVISEDTRAASDLPGIDAFKFEEAAVARFINAAEDATPLCREEGAAEIFSSPYLTNFSAKEFRSDYPEIDNAIKAKVLASDDKKVAADKEAKREAALDVVEKARKEHKKNMPFAQAAARARCNACPVQKSCNIMAMAVTNSREDARYLFGMVGGTSEQERRNVLRVAEQTGQSVLEVWPEDFASDEDLRDPLRDIEEKFNRLMN